MSKFTTSAPRAPLACRRYQFSAKVPLDCWTLLDPLGDVNGNSKRHWPNRYLKRGLVTLQQIHLKNVVWVKNDQLPKMYGLDWSNELKRHKPKIRERG